MAAKDKIILALDVSSEREAVELVTELKDCVGAFKIGLELFTSLGPRIIEAVKNAGAERIFFDGKFHDIPNTVAGAARAAARMGVWMMNVHASGGSAMMAAARDAAADEADKLGIPAPVIIAVTVLTSINAETLQHELSVPVLLQNQVSHLAQLAQNAGLDGVVASPHEIAAVKDTCGPEFMVVTPGVRPAWAATNDQKRIMTPGDAVAGGADYIVIGRAITAADDRRLAAEAIIAEIGG
ncbi:MAG TPA: orotidine-5'-phosphate decarboxylase [Armatimonadetes bacterium]|jgi:orotidine-5'-phosphate decarboxylase|nr:orotidine-5'-phosphate decarboxylase [Armatimonadota bacterium]